MNPVFHPEFSRVFLYYVGVLLSVHYRTQTPLCQGPIVLGPVQTYEIIAASDSIHFGEKHVSTPGPPTVAGQALLRGQEKL